MDHTLHVTQPNEKAFVNFEAINSFYKGVSSCQLYLELHNINNVKTLMTFSSIILAIGQ
jgi:hypothetical protein